MKKNYFNLALLIILGGFILGACGPSADKTTPTSTPLSVEAISTSAAQTVIAQFTLQAPTITPTVEFTNTPLMTATPATPQPTMTRAVPTAANCVNSILVSDVTIPDGTQLPVGTEFTKTWRVKNTGTCAWTTNFKLVYSYGDLMGGQTVPLANAVATGQTVDISVNLKVPNKTGKLEGVWGLVDDKGQRFGELIAVRITVGAISPTPTGSATATPTQTNTPNTAATPTSTPTPSETPTPTETLTETPTSTS